MRKYILAGLAGSAILMPAIAMGAGTTGAVQGTVSGTSGAPVQAPETGPNGTAIPEVPAEGTTTGIRSSGDTTGSIDSGKQGGASALDLQHNLSAKGYTDVRPESSSGASNSGNTRFTAKNAAGKNVVVTVNANTGAILSEKSAD